ncbi:MAG TPA: thioredoxin family protein [Chitinophaga sp.]|uniref:thioredoxin family protein n=1 Tax=Chitinophaga sp. TaxID=1869181 RepID=UPI002D10CAED|nr:thioredoxin family protein [Chitinophaga sp.]HVI46178.1 thioredoxin family protein [Chitinophaga sp.]
MKPFVLSLSIAVMLFSFAVTNAQQTPASAGKVLKDACTQAGKSKKKVFLIFHASWCGWCHKMDTAMNDVSCRKAFNDNYVICHITVSEAKDKKALENPGGEAMLQQYHGGQSGIPYWLVFDASGTLLADSRASIDGGKPENVGCPSKKEEVDYFISVLKKTSHMNATELQAVRTRFTGI